MSNELVWNRFSMRTVFHVSPANENNIFFSFSLQRDGVQRQGGVTVGAKLW